MFTHPVMVRVAFSPRVMPPSTLKTPSSQPVVTISMVSQKLNAKIHGPTADDLADADLGLEVTTAD